MVFKNMDDKCGSGICASLLIRRGAGEQLCSLYGQILLN